MDGCLSHPWIKNSESQGGVINKEGLSEFQAQYKQKVGLKCFTICIREYICIPVI